MRVCNRTNEMVHRVAYCSVVRDCSVACCAGADRWHTAHYAHKSTIRARLPVSAARGALTFRRNDALRVKPQLLLRGSWGFHTQKGFRLFQAGSMLNHPWLLLVILLAWLALRRLLTLL